MIGWGVFCLILAFYSMLAAAQSGMVTGVGVALFWAAIGSILIAKGRANKQKQQQAQQQTVIVNNYTTPPAASSGTVVRSTSGSAMPSADQAAAANARNTRVRVFSEASDQSLWRFYLVPPDDIEIQKQLHDFRIKKKAEGVNGVLLAESEDIGYAFRFDGLLLGTMRESDSEWLSAHEDEVETWTDFDLYGGDTDKSGCLRPVTTRITAKFSRAELDFPPCGPLPLLPSSVVHGDEVVYVSSTKKIHRGLSLSCSVNLKYCTPMLYEEALRDGCTECKNCFG